MELKPKGRGRKWLRGMVQAVIIAGVFALGINLGNGTIDLSRDQPVTGDLPERLDYSEVQQVYESLKENYNGRLNQEQLEEGLKQGLAASAKDPYTVYFTAQEAKEFNEQLTNSFSGIGAQLGLDKEGNVEVIAPIASLPADRAGIKAKDLIVTVNGQSTSGMSIDEAVQKIRGKAGTTVKLQIVRNRTQPLEFTITRQNIKIPSVETKLLDGNVGYIKISSFSDDTYRLAQQAARDFQSKQVKGVVLDMRNNPGGLLNAGLQVASLWLPPGSKILDEKRGNRVEDTQKAVGGNILTGTPTVVLVNGGSASASEIVAGALRDHRAARLIGEKTYGKGVVQDLINFRDGSQLKVTVAGWYRPSGQDINKKGIKPDQTVKLTETDAEAGKDPQLEAAQTYLNR